MKKVIPTIILLANINISFAQVNIEAFRDAANKNGFYGNILGSLQIQSGNTKVTIYDFSTDLHVKLKRSHILLKSSISRGFQDKKLFQNSGFSHFRYTFMLHDILGYEAFTQTEFDSFKDLKIRQLAGAGLRIETNAIKQLNINSGLGLMLDYEQLSNNITSRKPRINSYIVVKYNLNTKNKSFVSIVVYYQPLLINYKDWRLKNEINLKTNITKIKSTKIFAVSSFIHHYDSKPPTNITTDDKTLKISLGIEW
jgi:hypothetical protein